MVPSYPHGLGGHVGSHGSPLLLGSGEDVGLAPDEGLAAGQDLGHLEGTLHPEGQRLALAREGLLGPLSCLDRSHGHITWEEGGNTVRNVGQRTSILVQRREPDMMRWWCGGFGGVGSPEGTDVGLKGAYMSGGCWRWLLLGSRVLAGEGGICGNSSTKRGHKSRPKGCCMRCIVCVRYWEMVC